MYSSKTWGCGCIPNLISLGKKNTQVVCVCVCRFHSRWKILRVEWNQRDIKLLKETQVGRENLIKEMSMILLKLLP